MVRYIDVNKLEEMVIQSKKDNPHSNSIQRQMHTHEHRHFLCMLNQAPTADVVEVRHGEWLPYDYDEEEYQDVEESYNWRCSICQDDISYLDMVERDLLPNYCPNCGAKMDGKEIENET